MTAVLDEIPPSPGIDAPAPASPRRPVTVVLNGAAGALLDRPDAVRSLIALFEQVGLEPRFIPVEAGTLPERMALARDGGAEAMVVGGGDGTIACAAEILAGTGVAMGILPFGTMNLLAKDLGIPAGNPAAAVRILADGHVREIDVGEVNGRVFLCASMLGVPARLARVREAARGGAPVRLWTRFGLAALRALTRRSRLSVALWLDGHVIRRRAPSLTVSANALDDRSGRLFGRSRLDGGELAVYVIRHLGLGDLARLGLALAVGRWRQDRAVEEYRVRRLAIGATGRAVRVMNDGEVMLLAPPLRYRIRPRALRVIAPPAAPMDEAG
jgi:diacylglycerol kinase family enzyme